MTGSMQVRAAADAAVAEVPGHAFRVLADADATAGRYSLTEATSPPGASVPPHIHHGAVECFYVLDGEYRLTVSNRVHEAGPGDFLLVPRGAAHHFELTGTRTGRAVVIFSPAGFEQVFRAMPEIFGTPGEPGPVWERANLDQGTELLPPGEAHPSGPDALLVPAAGPADRMTTMTTMTSLAAAARTHTGLAITRCQVPRQGEWTVGSETCAAWVLSGALRIATGTETVTVRPGQLATFSTTPVRTAALGEGAALLVLSTSPVRIMPADFN